MEITPTYPGASTVIAETVAAPIEQEVNGVDGMLYIVSQSTGDGVTHQRRVPTGVNIDQAQVLVQNRVSVAEPRLPEEVRRFGVKVRKTSPDLMMVVHLLSPDGSLRPAIRLQLRDPQHEGRADPHRRRRRRPRVRRARLLDARLARSRQVQARGLTAGEVVTALRAANVAVSAGAVNQPPASSPGGFQMRCRRSAA